MKNLWAAVMLRIYFMLRHFLHKHSLTEVLFERTVQYLSERGLLVREGTKEALMKSNKIFPG